MVSQRANSRQTQTTKTELVNPPCPTRSCLSPQKNFPGTSCDSFLPRASLRWGPAWSEVPMTSSVAGCVPSKELWLNPTIPPPHTHNHCLSNYVKLLKCEFVSLLRGGRQSRGREQLEKEREAAVSSCCLSSSVPRPRQTENVVVVPLTSEWDEDNKP